jgi:nicotinamidase-related amidase
MKSALIVVDVQNDYFENGANPLFHSDQTLSNIEKLLDHFRIKHDHVVFIKHIATAATATFFKPETFGSEIHQELKPQVGEKIVVKHFPNSFRDTELQEILQEQEITHLVICGMMSHMCIDATTRAAKDLGYTCTVIDDACTTKDLEINGVIISATNVHNSFMAALNYFYSQVIKTESILNQ